MGQLADAILPASRLTRSYAEVLLKDIRPDQFARFASSGGKPVASNHPAFVYGHLSTYFPRLLAMLGAPPLANPPRFDELFPAGKECRDDPAGSVYPPMPAITAHYFAGFDAAAAAVQKASDADLARPNPAEGRMKEMFPTIGAVSNFILSAHQMSHLGQVSAWRRFVGFPPAM